MEHLEKTKHFCVGFFFHATEWAECCLGRLNKEAVKHHAQTICKVGHRKVAGMQSWRSNRK